MSSNISFTRERIENTVIKICNLLDSKENVTETWEDYSEQQLWFELVSCILGSRVRYVTAQACANHLHDSGLLEIRALLEDPEKAEESIRGELKKPIYPPFSQAKGSRYRHPNSKSRSIICTAVQIYEKEGLTIKDFLKKCSDSLEARDVLIRNCRGIGPKQASLFLRNISFCDDLAILDCHVNRYMELSKLNEKYGSVTNEKNAYFKRENVLRMYAISKRKSLATLDRGIWIVMRMVQEMK